MYFFLAPYEFLHDITCLLKKPFKSQYRQAVVSRFWTTLKNLSRSDQLLVLLNSFPSNPATYTIPESIRSGMPVFYLPANSSIPVLSSRWEPVVSFQKLIFVIDIPLCCTSYIIVFYAIYPFDFIMLYYINIWLHVSANYVVILRPYKHIKLTLQLQISFWIRMRSQSYCFTVHINKI